MQRLSDISTIRAVMEKNGFSFSKALGQNFLINPSVCPRMAALSGAADCAGAVEVGPGIGGCSPCSARRSRTAAT